MDIREVDLHTIWKIRQEVMYPAEELSYVQLPDDASGKHLGLYVGNVLVSIVSLFERDDALQFRKFATLVEEQGKGYGSNVLQYVVALGVAGGYRSIWCNARVSARGFYERFGMRITGDTWWQKDIEFVKMEKQFN
ncbi:MAG: GNAT family N-acetyltransferase [Chitinophagaceae bacterium]